MGISRGLPIRCDEARGTWTKEEQAVLDELVLLGGTIAFDFVNADPDGSVWLDLRSGGTFGDDVGLVQEPPGGFSGETIQFKNECSFYKPVPGTKWAVWVHY